jgi:multidrug efflux system membrane fusion protein
LPEINKARSERSLTVEALETDSKSVLDKGALEVVDNQVDQTTGTIRIKADFPNSELQLWPGQFVNVRLLLKTLDDVVVVPTAAVQRGPDGAFVYVIGADNKAAVRAVKVARQDDTVAVIAQGLAASDRVVTAGFARLKDGVEVTISGAPENAPVPPAAAPQASAGAPPDATASIGADAAQPSVRVDGKGKRGEGGKRRRRANAATTDSQ